MASLVRHDSTQYSWWWVSHISPKNSKWLQENLTDMDVKVKAMIKLINEDADSFARRAEMYYKKRPELMKLVEEFYRAYRALAERYDQATGALRQAHRTISEAFPNQMPSMSEESPTSGQEVEPRTPEMATPIRAPFDLDDLQKDALGVLPQVFTVKRNGTHPDEISALSSRKGLKQFNDLFASGESAHRVSFSDGKVRKGLSFESPEMKGKEDASNDIITLQQEISKLLAESHILKQQISSEYERANNAESEIQSLKDTISCLSSEKNTALLQYNESAERLTELEYEFSKAQAELKKLTDDMVTEVEKLNGAEARNHAMLSELKTLDQKARVQEQELEQKRKEMESFLSLQEEHTKCKQTENTLLYVEKQYAQSQEEANRLALDIKTANDKLNEFNQVKFNLEDTVSKLKQEVESLSEQNHSSELLIEELRCEINSLIYSKNKLESEIQVHKNTISQTNIQNDSSLFQHQKSIERVSELESKLSKAHSELEKIELKVKMLVRDPEQKREEVDIVHDQLRDEHHKCMQNGTACLAIERLHPQSQEEAKELTQDLENLNKKFGDLENDNLELQKLSQGLKMTISELSSQKDAALLQQQQSSERVSYLEAQLLQTQLELEKIIQKVQMLVQELEHKNDKVDNLHNSVLEESQKRMLAEAALLQTENLHSQSQDEAKKLAQDLESLSKKLGEVENDRLHLQNISRELKNTISEMNSEKDAALLQQQQSSEKVSYLERQLLEAQLELEKTKQKVQMLDQELEHKNDEVNNLHNNLQEEGQKWMEAEAALLMMENLHSKSQEEVNRLVLDLEKLTNKLSELQNSKLSREKLSCELEGTISLLNTEKDAAVLQQQKFLERVSDLESQVSNAQLELEKTEEKVQMLEQELAQKSEKVEILQLSLQDEGEKRVQAETVLLSMENLCTQSQEEVSRLCLEIERLNRKLDEVENALSKLKNTVLLLHSEKDMTLLQHQQSLVRVADLESERSKLHIELERIEQKVQMLEKELKQKGEEVDSLQISLQDESQKHIEGEATLLIMTNLHSQSQEEVNRLALEIKKLNNKLNEMENSNVDLVNMISMHTEDIHILGEQNLSAEFTIKGLRDELDALKEMKANLESEMEIHLGEKEVLQRDYVCQKEDMEILERKHCSLADEMEAVKSRTATLQKLLRELQIANFELKEVCAKHEVEKALLLEKVHGMEKLSEEYSVLENSLYSANAEMEALRENIKTLEASESSLKDDVSLHVSEKGTLALKLELLSKRIAEISEINSILEISLSDVNSELGELKVKLKDSEESCKSYLANNSTLLAEKNNIFSQLKSTTLALKALEDRYTDLGVKHSSLSRDKDLIYSQLRDLQDQLGIKNEEHKAMVKLHHMRISDFERQISSLQEKNCCMDEMLEQEQQKSINASICILILKNSLADVKDKNFTLFNECQKYMEVAYSSERLISLLKEEAKCQEEERKALLKHNEKLRDGISQHIKVLNICKDLGPLDIAHDEILLQILSHETSNLLKLKEEREDMTVLMDAELSVLATILRQIGIELRVQHLQKYDLEKEVETGEAKLLSLQNKNDQLLELNEQLRERLQQGGEREEELKTEVQWLHEKLSCLRESYQTSQVKICNLTKKNESLSQEYQDLIEKYDALDDENGAVLAECMMFDHLSLFFNGRDNESASAVASLTNDMVSLGLVKRELDHELEVLSRRATFLEVDNKHLKDILVNLVEVLRTRLVLLELDLDTSKSICQELSIELKNGMTQLMLKDDKLLKADEKVQCLQEKSQELCRVLRDLQVAIEGAKVVKGELEERITTLTEEGTIRDNEILLLRQVNKSLQGEVDILKKKEHSLTSMLDFVTEEVEQHEREIDVLLSNIITSSVSVMVYEEKALELMMVGEALEISAITQREMLMKEISSRDACIDELHKKIAGIRGENAELKAELSAYLPLIASLFDHVNVLEEGTLLPSEYNNSEDKVESQLVPCLQEENHGSESQNTPSGALQLQRLVARVEALRVVILDAKDRRDKESTESAAKLEAANAEIQELKAREFLCKEQKEQYMDDEKQKDDAENLKGKQVQIMKDIELDQISTCSPYGTGAALYLHIGNAANAELDDEMLQLWETAERDCKNQTAKSSSSEHDIQAVEEVKSEYPSFELARGRDLVIDRLEISAASLEPQQLWSQNVLEKLTSDAQRLSTIQSNIDEVKQKMEGSLQGKSPMSSEYSSIKTQLQETEGFVLEQIDFNKKLTKKAENYPALLHSVNAEQEGFSSRRKISEQVQKGSENVARLELELQKIQYVLLKLEEEQEYRTVKVPEKRARVLLRDYLYGRKDKHSNGQKKKKRVPFCGCVRLRMKTEP